MTARPRRFTGRFHAPRSLRKQLLAASLLILSGLLILIGVLQYVLMRNFIYSNRAEAMETQIRSVPFEIFNNSGNRRPGETGVPSCSTPILPSLSTIRTAASWI